MEFESLVDLIHFYEEHPLYGKVALKHAISEGMVTKMNTVSYKKIHNNWLYLEFISSEIVLTKVSFSRRMNKLQQ